MKTDTYQPSFFEQLRQAEEKHFWFHVRRRWILDRMRRVLPPPAHMLEVGCGTGNVSSFLARKGYTVSGCEYFDEALAMVRPGFDAVKGDASALPFGNGSFDIAGLFDVVEHFDDDAAVLREAARVVRRGGVIALTVPARKELWSSYDELSCHKKRYTKPELRQLLLRTDLSPLLLEYMFLTLYVPARMTRRAKKEVDLAREFRIHPLANAALRALCNGERILSRLLPLPIGTSLIAFAKKR